MYSIAPFGHPRAFGILISILVAEWGLACGVDASRVLLFRIPVSALPGGAGHSLAAGHAPTDTLVLRLNGVLYDSGRVSQLVKPRMADRAHIEAAIDASYSAFKTGDPEWILRTFAVEDHADVSSFLADSGVVAGSQAMFAGIDQMRVYAITEYEANNTEYRLVFFSYRESRQRGNVHVYVHQADEWRRTNALARDRTVLLAAMAFRFGTITLR